MSLIKNVVLWLVLFTAFALVTMLVMNLPSWIKENTQTNVIIQVTLYCSLALGFAYVIKRSLK